MQKKNYFHHRQSGISSCKGREFEVINVSYTMALEVINVSYTIKLKNRINILYSDFCWTTCKCFLQVI